MLSSAAIILAKLQVGDVIYFNALGRSIIVLNSAQAAIDLLDKRSSIYSDRPRFVMLVNMWVSIQRFLRRKDLHLNCLSEWASSPLSDFWNTASDSRSTANCSTPYSHEVKTTPLSTFRPRKHESSSKVSLRLRLRSHITGWSGGKHDSQLAKITAEVFSTQKVCYDTCHEARIRSRDSV